MAKTIRLFVAKSATLVVVVNMGTSRGTQNIAHYTNNSNSQSGASGVTRTADGGQNLRNAMSAGWSKNLCRPLR